MIPVLIWWFIIQIIGWLALPLSMRIFHWLPDRGYTSAKAVGLLVASYLLWFGASSGFLRNDLGGILVSLILLGGLSARLGLNIWQKRSAALPNGTAGLQETTSSLTAFLRSNRRLIVISEVVFALALILWALLRAYAAGKIMSTGGEKFMEFAFLNAILNSNTFPPLDPWLSGFAIAYYYFGYVMMALITRLSGVAPGVGFELYDALLFALTLLGSFGVVYNLVSAGLTKRTDSDTINQDNSRSIRYGLLGALFVTIMGNLTGPLEALRSRGVLPQAFFDWIAIPDLANAPVTGSWYPGGGGWWWWRGSRVIQDMDLAGNQMGVSPITEFPFFSFLLGDNHPHVLGLPFVLLGISLAFNLLLFQASREHSDPEDQPPRRWWNPIAFSLQGDAPMFFFAALLFGGLAFLNTWDFPIYLGLALLAYAAGGALHSGGIRRGVLTRTIVLGGWLIVGAIGLYLFFYTSFDSQAGGILPYIFPPTRLVQYLVMFGVLIFILFGFIVLLLAQFARQGLSVWSLALRSWGWTALVGAVLYGLIALSLAFGEIASRWIPQLNSPQLLSRLGGLSLGHAAQVVLLDRLQDPWLFLVLSALAGLALAALRMLVFAARAKEENLHTVSGAPRPSFPSWMPGVVFVLLLILVGTLLTWIVEFFYLQDSFMVRMNTVFKFYYQGWVMLGCASGYALWWLMGQPPGWLVAVRRALAVGAVFLILAGLIYPALAFYSRTAGFTSNPNLDGASELARNNPDDWAAIEWLKQEARQWEHPPVILEVPGKSYTYEGRISAFSGLPTVLGWAIHESQWRGNYDEQGKREPDIAAIYSTHDGSFALELLQKWDVDFVILGVPEQNYIQQLCTDPARRCNPTSAIRKFGQEMQPVFLQGNVTIYAVPGR
jgi:YYY domain-containing protein